MNKGIALALLIAGVILLVWGVTASDSVSSNVSEAVTGAPANKTIWLIIGGLILGLSGFVGLFLPRRSS